MYHQDPDMECPKTVWGNVFFFTITKMTNGDILIRPKDEELGGGNLYFKNC
jgi:hypothetical protein